MLHSVYQQIWKTQHWPQDRKRSVFISIPKGNAKVCSNYSKTALTSHAGKVMLKILQARLQQYMKPEPPDIHPLCEECSDFIYVDSMDERKNKFLENSDVFIISPGGIGTLDEFFEINTLKKLKQHDNEIIIFNINHFFDKMIEMIDENIVLK